MTELKPLFVSPRVADALGPYWQGLDRQELRLPRCSACGRWEWYPSASGPSCEGARFIWQAISPAATVFTFTRVHRPLLSGVTEPYVTGLVAPDDAPEVRLPARLEDAPELKIGARVRLDFLQADDVSFPYFRLESDL